MDEFGLGGVGQQFGGGMPPMNAGQPPSGTGMGMGAGMGMGGAPSPGLPPMGQPMPSATDPSMEQEIMALVQQLTSQYGMSPEEALQFIAQQTNAAGQPGVTPQDVMGAPAPQLSEADYMALAQQFGLSPSGTYAGTDPAYSGSYDIANILGRAYE